jgi:hypothetical protein
MISQTSYPPLLGDRRQTDAPASRLTAPKAPTRDPLSSKIRRASVDHGLVPALLADHLDLEALAVEVSECPVWSGCHGLDVALSRPFATHTPKHACFLRAQYLKPLMRPKRASENGSVGGSTPPLGTIRFNDPSPIALQSRSSGLDCRRFASGEGHFDQTEIGAVRPRERNRAPDRLPGAITLRRHILFRAPR